ncbi:hypothetical protein [uncultured Hyphomonas sp.]|uniref:hypothetical protein n=1 Tax=uncultured Hyphomonas sp. TaxID=225298 RepID=UPI002AABEA8F|nr:hypothetical protein [uncultured Hyphomonas sp.]
MRRAILFAAVGALAACTSRGTDEAGRQAPLPAQPDTAYELPTGGPHSISISVMDCEAGGCPVVNVLLDPDNYWQRTAEDGAYSGIAPGNLYASVKAAFEDQGFDDTDSVLDITKDNPALCPQYLRRGRVYYIHLGRGETGQRIDYDTGCSGSLDARRAEFVTEALAEMPDLTHLFEGAVTLEDDMGDEE